MHHRFWFVVVADDEESANAAAATAMSHILIDENGQGCCQHQLGDWGGFGGRFAGDLHRKWHEEKPQSDRAVPSPDPSGHGRPALAVMDYEGIMPPHQIIAVNGYGHVLDHMRLDADGVWNMERDRQSDEQYYILKSLVARSVVLRMLEAIQRDWDSKTSMVYVADVNS